MRLLIVDDERNICTFIGLVARDRGWTAEAAATEKEFRAAYERRKPDAIVLDLQLGRSDGIEQLRFLDRARFTGCLLLLSGVDERVLTAAYERACSLGLYVAGAETKPLRVKRLRELLIQLEQRISSARGVAREVSAAANITAGAGFAPDAIAAAIASGQMELHFQPIVTLAGNGVSRLEALIRWRHPEHGMIAPDQFIAIAEKDETTIDQLTFWVMGTAIAAYKRLALEGLAVPISVNLSRVNLHALDFPDRAAAFVERMRVTPSTISFELTESVALSDPGKVVDILARLRLKGFELMIDDFGTGYSSLQTLRHMPFSEIKLDKSFIRDLPRSQDSLAIVRSVVDMAHNLKLQTVAEGVETAAEAEALGRLGVTALQGYYFSRPLPLDAIIAWLAAVPADLIVRGKVSGS